MTHLIGFFIEQHSSTFRALCNYKACVIFRENPYTRHSQIKTVVSSLKITHVSIKFSARGHHHQVLYSAKKTVHIGRSNQTGSVYELTRDCSAVLLVLFCLGLAEVSSRVLQANQWYYVEINRDVRDFSVEVSSSPPPGRLRTLSVDSACLNSMQLYLSLGATSLWNTEPVFQNSLSANVLSLF